MKLVYTHNGIEAHIGDSVAHTSTSGIKTSGTVMGIFPPSRDFRRTGKIQVTWPTLGCTGNYEAEVLGLSWFVPLPKWEAPVLRKFAPPVSAALTPVGMSEISQELDAAFEQIAELRATLNRLSAILSGKP